MKKLVSFSLVILLVMAAVCGVASGVDVQSLSDDQLVALKAEVSAELSARAPTSESTAQVGEATVTIKGARMSHDYEGKDCLVVAYEWSHQEDEAKNFMFYFSDTVFQGGIELESAMMVDGVDSSPAMLDIRAGAVLEVEKAYVLRDATSPVEIEVKELITFTDTGKLEATFSLPL